MGDVCLDDQDMDSKDPATLQSVGNLPRCHLCSLSPGESDQPERSLISIATFVGEPGQISS